MMYLTLIILCTLIGGCHSLITTQIIFVRNARHKPQQRLRFMLYSIPVYGQLPASIRCSPTDSWYQTYYIAAIGQHSVTKTM